MVKVRRAKSALQKFERVPLSEVNKKFDFGRPGKQSSQYWDLRRNGLSVSGIGCWLQCREQFRLKYVEGWEGSGYSYPIEFGNIFHYLHEQWVRVKSFNLKQTLAVYQTRWNSEHPLASSSTKEQQEWGYVTASAMWPLYVARYAADKKRNWVGTELEFKLPVVINGSTTTNLHGFMDGVWLDGSRVMLHEMKTKSVIDTGLIEDALWLDLQTGTYLWVLWQLYPGKEYGMQYDVIRRPRSNPHKHESMDAYRKRIGKIVELDPRHYFYRFDFLPEKTGVNQFYNKVLFPILTDLALWADGKTPHYPTPDALVGKYGPCDMYYAIANHNLVGLRRKSCGSNPRERRP